VAVVTLRIDWLAGDAAGSSSALGMAPGSCPGRTSGTGSNWSPGTAAIGSASTHTEGLPDLRLADKESPVKRGNGMAGRRSGTDCACLSADKATRTMLQTRCALRAKAATAGAVWRLAALWSLARPES